MSFLTLRAYTNIDFEFNEATVPEKDRLRTWSDFIYYAKSQGRKVGYDSGRGVYSLHASHKISPIILFQKATEFAQTADDRGLALEVFQHLKERIKRAFYFSPFGIIRRILSIAFSRFSFENSEIYKEIESIEKVIEKVDFNASYYHLRDRGEFRLKGISFSPDRVVHTQSMIEGFKNCWKSCFNSENIYQIIDALSNEYAQLIPDLYDPFEEFLVEELRKQGLTPKLKLKQYFKNKSLNDLTCENLIIKKLPKIVSDLIRETYTKVVKKKLLNRERAPLTIKESIEGSLRNLFFLALEGSLELEIDCCESTYDRIMPTFEHFIEKITRLKCTGRCLPIDRLFDLIQSKANRKKTYPRKIELWSEQEVSTEMLQAFLKEVPTILLNGEEIKN